MTKTARISLAIACGLSITACQKGMKHTTPNHPELTKTEASTSHNDTLLVITMPDNAIWGHLGENTGMSVLEFITDKGDTLYLSKESEITGQAGAIYGSIRNNTDRFCITTTDDGATLQKAINVTEMQEIWTDKTHIEK